MNEARPESEQRGRGSAISRLAALSTEPATTLTAGIGFEGEREALVQTRRHTALDWCLQTNDVPGRTRVLDIIRVRAPERDASHLEFQDAAIKMSCFNQIEQEVVP